MNLAIIIPAKNEAKNLPDVLGAIHVHAPYAKIYVVNDCSTDNTLKILQNYPGVSVLTSTIPLGIGKAVQLGIRCALENSAEVILRLDGDGQHSARYIPELLAQLNQFDFIQGYRTLADFSQSSTFLRRQASFFLQTLFSLFLRKRVYDPTSGYFVISAPVANAFANYYPVDFPEVESKILLLRAGFRLGYLPMQMEPRQSGQSHIRFWAGIVFLFSITITFITSILKENPYQHYGNNH